MNIILNKDEVIRMSCEVRMLFKFLRLQNSPTNPNYARGLYFLLNDNDVVYIGFSKNIINRIKWHKYNSRYKKFDAAFFLNRHDYTEDQLRELERQYIYEYKPVFNYSRKEPFEKYIVT